MIPKELVDARETYQAAVASTGPLLQARRRDDVFALERAEGVVEAVLAQLEVSDALLVPFLSALTGSSTPAGETLGPCILALRIAIELEYPRAEMSRLGLAALAHEIGRARAPKGGDATAVGRGVEEQIQLVRHCGPAYADVADLVRLTHEMLGEVTAPVSEPARVHGDSAHIIGLATIYHGLAHQRGTEHAWPPERLKAILRAQRARFPDRILKSLIRVLTTLPLGGFVRLNNGETGYVMAKNAGFPLRPVVAVWFSLGKLLAEPKTVDLQRDPFLYVEAFLGDARLGPDRGGLPS